MPALPQKTSCLGKHVKDESGGIAVEVTWIDFLLYLISTISTPSYTFSLRS